MNSNAKRGTVSAFQFFSIIFISRAVVSFTYIQTISVGRFASDILIAYAISFFLSLLLSFPAVMCEEKVCLLLIINFCRFFMPHIMYLFVLLP